jgi:hypothetical protein
MASIKTNSKSSSTKSSTRSDAAPQPTPEATPEEKPPEATPEAQKRGSELPDTYDDKGEVSAEFALAIQSLNPNALKKSGLKTLQELMHGHRDKLEKDDNDRLKSLHKGLRKAMRAPVADIVNSADSAEITKDLTTMDNIRRIGSRLRMVRLENETDYKLIG